MAKSAEQFVVDLVESSLDSAGLWWANVHGEARGAQNGVPDVITLDARGRLCGIECKARGEEPVFTQWLQAQRIVASGGRYIVAYEDFDVGAFARGELPVAELGRDEADCIAMRLPDRKTTREVVLAPEE